MPYFSVYLNWYVGYGQCDLVRSEPISHPISKNCFTQFLKPLFYKGFRGGQYLQALAHALYGLVMVINGIATYRRGRI